MAEHSQAETTHYIRWQSEYADSDTQTTPIFDAVIYSDILDHIGSHPDYEVGGFLLGEVREHSEDDGTVRLYTLVTGILRVEKEDAGPEIPFHIVNEDYDKAAAQAIPGQYELVGWFRSSVGNEAASYTIEDTNLHKRFFPGEHQFGLILNLDHREARCYVGEKRYAKVQFDVNRYFGFIEMLDADSEQPQVTWRNLTNASQPRTAARARPSEPPAGVSPDSQRIKLKPKNRATAAEPRAALTESQATVPFNAQELRMRLEMKGKAGTTSRRANPMPRTHTGNTSDAGRIRLSGKAAAGSASGSNRINLSRSAAHSSSDGRTVVTEFTEVLKALRSYARQSWQKVPHRIRSSKYFRGVLGILVILMLGILIGGVIFGGSTDELDAVITQEPEPPTVESNPGSSGDPGLPVATNSASIQATASPTNQPGGNNASRFSDPSQIPPQPDGTIFLELVSGRTELRNTVVQQPSQLIKQVAQGDLVEFNCRWITSLWYGVVIGNDPGFIYTGNGTVWRDSQGETYALRGPQESLSQLQTCPRNPSQP